MKSAAAALQLKTYLHKKNDMIDVSNRLAFDWLGAKARQNEKQKKS
jgi:hypothetical protein